VCLNGNNKEQWLGDLNHVDAASFLNGKKAQIIIDGTQSRSGMFQAGSFKLGNFYRKK